jgi:hypothetical protein
MKPNSSGLGKKQRALLKFLRANPGWHSVTSDSIGTAKSLHDRWLCHTNEHKQARASVFKIGKEIAEGDIIRQLPYESEIYGDMIGVLPFVVFSKETRYDHETGKPIYLINGIHLVGQYQQVEVGQ